MKKYYLGSIYALLSASGFGIIPLLATVAYQYGANVINLLFIRFLISASLIFFYIFLTKGNIKITKKELLLLLLLGFVYSGFSFSYFSAIKYIPAALAVLIFYVYPILVTVISYIIKKERQSSMIILAIILSMTGLIIILKGDYANISSVGIFFSLTAALCYAVYAIMGNIIQMKISTVTTIAYACLFAAFIFFIAAILTSNMNFNFEAKAWFPILIITIISAFGFLGFFQGMKLTSPSITAILSMTEPLVTVFFSLVIFQDKLNWLQLLGGAFVLWGSLQVIIKGNTKERLKQSA